MDNLNENWANLISCQSNLQSVAINKNHFTVGRSPNSDVVILERNFGIINVLTVSKEHFMIYRDSGSSQAFLKDTSKNGTWVNGVKVERNNVICLKNDDIIAVGMKDARMYKFQNVKEELPDTLTPSSNLEIIPQYTEVLPIWSRLVSRLLYLNSYDIHQYVFKVGRDMSCDVVISRTNLPEEQKSIFSKEHFVIYRNMEENITFIKDISKGGTFLNGRLIGKNQMNILQNDDIISIGGGLEVFIYKCMYVNVTNFLPHQFKTNYEVSKILGKGGAGEVRLAYEKYTCNRVAIKKIIKARSGVSQLCLLNHPSKIKNEIEILRALKFPFIISMKNIVETSSDVFIMLDYMKGGELTKRIVSKENLLSESNAKFFFYQMVLALDYLHSKGITHRDLKPQNVLLDSDELETLLKVSDFGLSKVIKCSDDVMKTICGTLSYIAPEILDRNIPEYNRQVDVWSLGVILFYMLVKVLPFRHDDKGVLEKLIIAGDYHLKEKGTHEYKVWKKVSSPAKDLIKKMLNVNPERRINVTDILAHPWLTQEMEMQRRVNQLYQSQLEFSDASSDSETSSQNKRFRFE